MNITKIRKQFPDDVRRNWGYWDGRADKEHGRGMRYLPSTFHQDRPLPYWDTAYCEGYNKGFESL